MADAESTVQGQAGSPRRIGRYQVVAELGAGGMGKVYRAIDPNLGREVAVKTVHAAGLDGPGARVRFDREARALAALRHDHILAVHDYSGLDADPIYLVTELIDGDDLSAILSRRGRLSAAAAVAVLRAVASGLGAAHGIGLIHRDVKPANILVSRTGRVVLADFGVARPPTAPSAEGSTQSLTFAGTPGYMSPEQIEGRDLDARSDLWSLGATAYELATGERPFAGRNLHEALGRALEGDYRLASTQPELDPELAALIDRCLARDRDRRPSNAAEVVAALDRLAARVGGTDLAILVTELPAPELARADTALAQPSSPSRARKRAVAASLTLAVIALALVAFVMGRRTKEEPEAEADPVVGINTVLPPDAGTVAVVSPSPAPAPAIVPSTPSPSTPSPSTPSPPAPSPKRTPTQPPSPRIPVIPLPPGGGSRDPATLDAATQRELQALLMEANTASVNGDHARALAAAEKVIARTESRMALYMATQAACELGDAARARRYYPRIIDANLSKVVFDLCAVKDIFVNDEAKNSRWAVFNRLNRNKTKAHEAQTKGDFAAMLTAAKAIIADAQDQDDRFAGHEFAVRAACGLGDAGAAQKYLAGTDTGDQSDLVDYCQRKHGITVTRP
jgi:serine/threonine protein kinase